MKLLQGLFFLLIGFSLSGCIDVSGESNKTVAENQRWKESPRFEANNYSMIGEEGRASFIFEDNEVDRFYVKKPAKYMWHFWGSEEELTGAFEVIGTHENSNEKIIVVPKGKPQTFLSPNNSADHHIPTIMALPEKGMWKLEAVFGGNVIGTVFVEVHEQ